MNEHIEKIKKIFRGVVSIAWDNAPDAIPDYYEEFRQNMEQLEEEFQEEMDLLEKEFPKGMEKLTVVPVEKEEKPENETEKELPDKQDPFKKIPLEIDSIMETYLKEKKIRLKDGHLYLTKDQVAKMSDTGGIGKSIRDPRIRTMTVPSVYGTTLIFEYKHWSELVRPFISGHGSSEYFICGKCRKGICDWREYGKILECPNCKTAVDWLPEWHGHKAESFWEESL